VYTITINPRHMEHVTAAKPRDDVSYLSPRDFCYALVPFQIEA
jgi:hypothetical protein